jgi:hypothetical protein
MNDALILEDLNINGPLRNFVEENRGKHEKGDASKIKSKGPKINEKWPKLGVPERQA